VERVAKEIVDKAVEKYHEYMGHRDRAPENLTTTNPNEFDAANLN
jgi:hypothetical protein